MYGFFLIICFSCSFSPLFSCYLTSCTMLFPFYDYSSLNEMSFSWISSLNEVCISDKQEFLQACVCEKKERGRDWGKLSTVLTFTSPQLKRSGCYRAVNTEKTSFNASPGDDHFHILLHFGVFVHPCLSFFFLMPD